MPHCARDERGFLFAVIRDEWQPIKKGVEELDD
jgi:hypothetical protein